MSLLSAYLSRGIPKGNLLERYMMKAIKGGTPVDVDAWVLDYIESDGAQYVNTGFVADNLTGKTTISTMTNELVSSIVGIYGHRVSLSDRNTLFSYDVNLYYGGNSATTLFSNYETNAKYDFVIDRDNNSVSVNGVEQSIGVSATITENQPQYLFWDGSATETTGRIYNNYVEQDVNGTELLHFLTVQLASDKSANSNITGSTDGVTNEYGFWDMEANCFHGNLGTGNFTGGSRIGYVLNGIAYNMEGTEMFPTS